MHSCLYSLDSSVCEINSGFVSIIFGVSMFSKFVDNCFCIHWIRALVKKSPKIIYNSCDVHVFKNMLRFFVESLNSRITKKTLSSQSICSPPHPHPFKLGGILVHISIIYMLLLSLVASGFAIPGLREKTIVSERVCFPP